MKTKNIQIVFMSFLIFSSCVKTDNYNTPNYEELRNKEIQKVTNFDGNKITYNQLKALSSSEIEKYTNNDFLEGYVVSSDDAGNFYKEMYVQAADKSGTVLVILNKKGLYGDYPIGSKVQIRLKGTTFWTSYNTLEIGYGAGYTSTGRKKMGYLPESMIDNVVVKTGETAEVSALAEPFVSLRTLARASNLNKLVTIKNVQFRADAVGKTFYSKTDQYTTSHILQDATGGEIDFVTSSFASYTNEKVPSGKFNITGILTQYGSKFQLEISRFSDLEKVE